jgi:hypothetical protein
LNASSVGYGGVGPWPLHLNGRTRHPSEKALFSQQETHFVRKKKHLACGSGAKNWMIFVLFNTKVYKFSG